MSRRDDLRTTLGNLLEDEMGDPYDLEDSRDLREGLGLDSVDIVGLVMRIEREFRIRLSMEDLAAVKTVGEMIDLIDLKVSEAAGSDQSTRADSRAA